MIIAITKRIAMVGLLVECTELLLAVTHGFTIRELMQRVLVTMTGQVVEGSLSPRQALLLELLRMQMTAAVAVVAGALTHLLSLLTGMLNSMLISTSTCTAMVGNAVFMGITTIGAMLLLLIPLRFMAVGWVISYSDTKEVVCVLHRRFLISGTGKPVYRQYICTCFQANRPVLCNVG